VGEAGDGQHDEASPASVRRRGRATLFLPFRFGSRSALAQASGGRFRLRTLEVRGAGDVTRRLDGRLGFTVVELEAVLETDPGHEADARFAAKVAEQVCLVSASLDAPVHVAVDVRAAPTSA
jgi:hypothetical protein